MPYHVAGLSDTTEHVALANMFRARKRVFIDLLKWDIPALADNFEVDQFDTASTTYLMLAEPDGTHLGSMRLLPSTGPNILGSIFPDLCDDTPPADDGIWEISRFCLSRDVRAAERRLVRNRLITLAVTFARQRGITAFCCVADLDWTEQIPQFGWRCAPLGPPCPLPCGLTRAIRIDIDAETPALMAAAGTWLPFATTDGEPLGGPGGGHVLN
jgi:N-acyl-L-homoserine lactone synthetase